MSQVHITNMHLAELASHLTEVLEEQMRAADVEITMLSELLMSTLATQVRKLLVFEALSPGRSVNWARI